MQESIKTITQPSEDSGLEGAAALIHAARSGDLEMLAKIIMQHAKDLGISLDNADDLEAIRESIIQGADALDDALFQAAEIGDVQSVKELIAIGANIHSKDRLVGDTPLIFAANNGHLEVVRLLLTKGAKDLYGAIFNAASSGHIDIVKLLIEQGADLPALNEALSGAARSDQLEIVNLLIASGAEIGYALPGFALRGRSALAQKLLENGADMNITGCDGTTALFRFVKCRELELTTELLNRGCSIDSETLCNLASWIKEESAVKLRPLCHAIINNYNSNDNPSEDLQNLVGYALLQLSKTLQAKMQKGEHKFQMNLHDLITQGAINSQHPEGPTVTRLQTKTALCVLQQRLEKDFAVSFELSSQVERAVLHAISQEQEVNRVCA